MIFPASMGSLNCTSSASHDVCYAGLGGKHPRSLLYTRARGRIVREVGRSIARRPEIEATLERPLARADQNPSQQQRQSGNSSASARATRARPTNSTSRPRSSLPMLAHRAASSCSTRRCCQGDPYDGHTLGALVEDTPKGLRAWNRIARLAGPLAVRA
jgi:hypothetical protein